jgi:polyisoprenoid-binding protein YceI
MKFSFAMILVTAVFVLGCDEAPAPPRSAPATPSAPSVTAPAAPAETQTARETQPVTPTPAPRETQPAAPTTPPVAAAPGGALPEGFTPVPAAAGIAKVSADNTTVQFVGKHVDGGENDPQARTGVFEKLTGQVEIDPATKMLKSASAEIDATSLFVPIQQLQDHLRSEDFLSVREFPTIKFQTTQIAPAGDPGKVNITGDLTLHGVTKSITIPATYTVTDAGVTIVSDFKITRADFGMTGQERVQPNVELKVMVGKKTERPAGRGRRRTP